MKTLYPVLALFCVVLTLPSILLGFFLNNEWVALGLPFVMLSLGVTFAALAERNP